MSGSALVDLKVSDVVGTGTTKNKKLWIKDDDLVIDAVKKVRQHGTSSAIHFGLPPSAWGGAGMTSGRGTQGNGSGHSPATGRGMDSVKTRGLFSSMVEEERKASSHLPKHRQHVSSFPYML